MNTQSRGIARVELARDFAIAIMSDRDGMDAIRRASNTRNTIESLVVAVAVAFADELLKQTSPAP